MGPKKHPQQTTVDQALDEAARVGMKACTCGALMSPRAALCRRCVCRRAQARYRRTTKGKVSRTRYSRSPHKRAANARYLATAHGQQTKVAHNACRIFVGSVYHGHAQTVEQAAAIRLHIKERVREFISRQQTGAETEGTTPGTVSAQTEPRAY